MLHTTSNILAPKHFYTIAQWEEHIEVHVKEGLGKLANEAGSEPIAAIATYKLV